MFHSSTSLSTCQVCVCLPWMPLEWVLFGMLQLLTSHPTCRSLTGSPAHISMVHLTTSTRFLGYILHIFPFFYTCVSIRPLHVSVFSDDERHHGWTTEDRVCHCQHWARPGVCPGTSCFSRIHGGRREKASTVLWNSSCQNKGILCGVECGWASESKTCRHVTFAPDSAWLFLFLSESWVIHSSATWWEL